jgi:EAL domain-containing protein (putative c-di-GMP-specific phosphodiesterase class I)
MINSNELSILLVEDDVFQRNVLTIMLNQIGFNLIREADNGMLALDILNSNSEKSIDIIICDLNMPEMDGLEFLRHLGKSHHNVAIIILSALGNQLLFSSGKIAKLHGIKLLGAIDKPIKIEKLESLLNGFSRTENKWQLEKNTRKFTIEEILQGISKVQFEPFFQPKIDLKTGKIIGAETLARWKHPEYGIVGPASFIPLLENSGKIDDLTFQIIEKSASAYHLIPKTFKAFTFSINLSPSSLEDFALANKIANILRKADLSPSNFIVEITESLAMTDEANALENLGRLYMRGFALSVDDYGTGFSSLQQLTRIAFSELKIDQSFIKELAINEYLRIMVKSSIELAHNLNLKCVAEGVETSSERDILLEMGCDIIQGYLISKPLDLPSFIDFCNKF